jgi:hypothetical protein
MRLALLLALYLSVDVASPQMPGALMFGVDAVDIRQVDRSRVRDDVPLEAHEAPDRAVAPTPPPTPATGRVASARAVAACVARSCLPVRVSDRSPEEH